MTRRRSPDPAPPKGRPDRATDAPLERLDVGLDDEAVAVLVEDAFDEPLVPDDGVAPITSPGWTATIRPMVARWVEIFVAWCLVSGAELRTRFLRWQRVAGLWAADALTIVGAWVVATSVTLGIRARRWWRVGREYARQRRAAHAVSGQARRTAPDAPLGVDQLRRPAETPRAVTSPADTLRDAALRAWGAQRDQQVAQQAQVQRRRTARDANALRRLAAARLGLQITPAAGVVDVDGLRLGVIRGEQVNDYVLVLLSTCPACGAPVASADLRGLADLGAAVDAVNARRNLCQECRTAAEAAVSADPEQLVAALREVLGGDGLRTLTTVTAPPHRPNGSTPRAAQGRVESNGHAPVDGRRDRGAGRTGRTLHERPDG